MEPTVRLTLDQIERMPPEALALELLQRLPERQAVRRDRFLFEVLNESRPRQPAGNMTVTHSDDLMQEHQAAVMSLVEGWQRLVLDGLLVDWPPKDRRYTTEGHGEMYQLTRWAAGARARWLWERLDCCPAAARGRASPAPCRPPA